VASHLILSHLIKPIELVRKLKVIVAYRKAQELLRLSSQTYSPYTEQLKVASIISKESELYVKAVVQEWFEKRPLPFIRILHRRELESAFFSLNYNGLKLGVLSDYPAHEKIKALKIDKYVNVIVSSSDKELLGFKPKTNGFRLAAQKMELDPKHILYIGDRPEVDGVGATTAGMQAVILRNGIKKTKNSQYPTIRSLNELLKILPVKNQPISTYDQKL
jgi:FMN phosphatase YigB (HAD superfamily)